MNDMITEIRSSLEVKQGLRLVMGDDFEQGVARIKDQLPRRARFVYRKPSGDEVHYLELDLSSRQKYDLILLKSTTGDFKATGLVPRHRNKLRELDGLTLALLRIASPFLNKSH